MDDEQNKGGYYEDLVQNTIDHHNKLMHIKTISNIADDPDNEQVKRFIPVGKDLVNSNFSSEVDGLLFIKQSQLLVNLQHLQKRDFSHTRGIIPSVELYCQRIMYHSIYSRAKGDDRERKLQANAAHRQYDKPPSSVDKMFGLKPGQ